MMSDFFGLRYFKRSAEAQVQSHSRRDPEEGPATDASFTRSPARQSKTSSSLEPPEAPEAPEPPNEAVEIGGRRPEVINGRPVPESEEGRPASRHKPPSARPGPSRTAVQMASGGPLNGAKGPMPPGKGSRHGNQRPMTSNKANDAFAPLSRRLEGSGKRRLDEGRSLSGPRAKRPHREAPTQASSGTPHRPQGNPLLQRANGLDTSTSETSLSPSLKDVLGPRRQREGPSDSDSDSSISSIPARLPARPPAVQPTSWEVSVLIPSSKSLESKFGAGTRVPEDDESSENEEAAARENSGIPGNQAEAPEPKPGLGSAPKPLPAGSGKGLHSTNDKSPESDSEAESIEGDQPRSPRLIQSKATTTQKDGASSLLQTPIENAGTRPYRFYRTEAGRLESAYGALLPENYQVPDSAEHKWKCPVRDCGAPFKAIAGLGGHFNAAHCGRLFNDNGDGTLSVVGKRTVPDDYGRFPAIVVSKGTPGVYIAPPVNPSLSGDSHKKQQPGLPKKNEGGSKATMVGISTTPIPLPGRLVMFLNQKTSASRSLPVRAADGHQLHSKPHDGPQTKQQKQPQGSGQPSLPTTLLRSTAVNTRASVHSDNLSIANLLEQTKQTSAAWKYIEPRLNYTFDFRDDFERKAFIQIISLDKQRDLDDTCLQGLLKSHQRRFWTTVTIAYHVVGVKGTCNNCEENTRQEKRHNCFGLPPNCPAELVTLVNSRCSNCVFLDKSRNCDFSATEPYPQDHSTMPSPRKTDKPTGEDSPRPRAGAARSTRSSTRAAASSPYKRPRREIGSPSLSAGQSRDFQAEMAGWEMAPGRQRAAENNSLGSTNVMFSAAFLGNAQPVPIGFGVKAHYVVVKRGLTHRWDAEPDKVRMVWVVRGKVGVEVSGLREVAGPLAMFKIRPGHACLVENGSYELAELLVQEFDDETNG